jgi:energy-coupling factor transporter transmembrane protein EcfT/ABC-type iron transport system FetAB ATPase subunit
VVTAGRALSGALDADPRSWRSPELAPRIGWVAQHPEHAFVGRTVRGEVLAGLRGRVDDPTQPTSYALARADGLLLALGLDRLAAADPYRLSGGEQRRLAVAAALAQGPQVLLLDEPTLGQDRRTWAAVAGAIRAARDGGTAIALATHDHRLVQVVADYELTLVPLDGLEPTRSGPIEPAPRRAWPPVTRCGPLAGLVVSVLAVVASVFVRNWPVGVAALAAELLVAPLAIGSLRTASIRIAPGLLAAVSVGWSSWLLGGHDPATGLTAGLRILVLVLPGALLTAHLDASRLGDDLAQRLHLPARPVVATVAALQRVEALGSVWAEAAWARKVRGLGAGRSPVARVREVGALTFVLLVQTIRQAGQMAVAMDARGFAGARHRTWAEPSRWRWADSVLVVVGLVVLSVPVVLDVTRM